MKFLNVYFLILIVLLIPFPTVAAEETIKIFSTQDGMNQLYDDDDVSDWLLARNYEDKIFRDTFNDLDLIKVRSDNQVNNSYRIYRGSLFFDLSKLPEGSRITDVNFFAFKTIGNNPLPEIEIVFTSHNRLTKEVLQKQDWNINNYGDDAFSRGFLDDDKYTVFNFSDIGVDYVDKNRQLVIGVLSGFDFDSVDPGSSQTGATFYTMEVDEPEKRPYLEIKYTLDEQDDRRVPLITQSASPFPPESASWADELYADGRAAYEGSCGSTIRQCGCALASFAMLGQGYGLETGVDGSAATPPNIDAWLLGNGGYDARGNIIWNQAVKYFGVEVGGAIKSFLTLDSHNETSLSVIEDRLDNNEPVIFKTKATNRDGSQFTHFILGTQTDGDDTLVNDPLWYNTINLNDERDRDVWVQDYNDRIDAGRLFSFSDTPQQVAGSISLLLSSPAELLIRTDQGDLLGTDPVAEETYSDIPGGVYFAEGAFYSEELADSGEVPHVTKTIDIQEPEDGIYTIEVIGTDNGEYNLAIHTNDASGVGSLQNISGLITEGERDVFVLLYGESSERNDLLKKITFLKKLVRFLPKKPRALVKEDVLELQREVTSVGVISLENPLAQLLLSEERLTVKSVLKYIKSVLDHDHGHGNDEDGCDEDNRGKKKDCQDE